MQKSFLATAIGLAMVFQSGHALAGKGLDAVLFPAGFFKIEKSDCRA